MESGVKCRGIMVTSEAGALSVGDSLMVAIRGLYISAGAFTLRSWRSWCLLLRVILVRSATRRLNICISFRAELYVIVKLWRLDNFTHNLGEEILDIRNIDSSIRTENETQLYRLGRSIRIIY